MWLWFVLLHSQSFIRMNTLMLLRREGCLWLGRMLAWTPLFLNPVCVCYSMCCRRLHSLQPCLYALDCSLYYAFAFIPFDVLRQIPRMTETCLCMSQPTQDGWNMADTRPHKKEAFSMPVFTYMSSHCFYCCDGFFCASLPHRSRAVLMSRADQQLWKLRQKPVFYGSWNYISLSCCGFIFKDA